MGEGDNGGAPLRYVYMIMIGTLLSGAINNIAMKQQDETDETGVTPTRQWQHPFLQVFIMFIAEFLCMIAFQILYRFNNNFRGDYETQLVAAVNKGLRTDVHPLVTFIPAVCDICGSSLQFISLNLINQSIYVMLRGGVPVLTAFLSVVFLGRKLYSHHFLGLTLAVVGITIVGISQFISDTSTSSNIVLGLICVLLSLCTTGVQFIIEEKILTSFYILPLKMVGMEGMWGLMLSTGALLVASYMPCTYLNSQTSDPTCQPNGYVEDIGQGISTIFNTPEMMLWVLLGITSLSFFNFCGVSVTKYVSSLARSILNITVTVLIWVFDLAARYESFQYIELIGFIVLVAGNLIYQEIIEIPGMNKNTKKNLARLSLVADEKAFENSVDSGDLEGIAAKGRESKNKY